MWPCWKYSISFITFNFTLNHHNLSFCPQQKECNVHSGLTKIYNEPSSEIMKNPDFRRFNDNNDNLSMTRACNSASKERKSSSWKDVEIFLPTLQRHRCSTPCLPKPSICMQLLLVFNLYYLFLVGNMGHSLEGYAPIVLWMQGDWLYVFIFTIVHLYKVR